MVNLPIKAKSLERKNPVIKQTPTILRKPVIIVIVSFLVVALIYSSSFTLLVFGKKSVPSDQISCYPQDGGKTRCCGSEMENSFYTGVTYCTTCDNTSPPSHCTPREKITLEMQQPTTTPPKLSPDGSILPRRAYCNSSTT